jgi:hypothetical protein
VSTDVSEEHIATIFRVEKISSSRNQRRYIPKDGSLQDFYFLHVFQTGSGTHLAPYPMGTGTKQPEHEADHSHSFGAKVKNTWIYTFTPPWVFMA